MISRVAAVLLAAGKSSRMGCCKQLLPLGGNTVIGCCLETLIASGVSELVAVVSADGHDVAAEAGKYPVKIVVNHCGDGDMSSSVRTGRDAVSADITAVVVALCDYPLVLPATIGHLIRGHAEHPDRIVIPGQSGRRGHPLLFPRPVLNELSENLILRDLVLGSRDRVIHVEVNDPGILIDMDTPQDYLNICDTFRHR